MDDDLAFCFRCFAKDQIEEIQREIGETREVQLQIEPATKNQQQILAIELAGAFRQLAIGSTQADEFNREFQTAIRDSTTVPLILARIDQHTDLPLTIHLKGDFDHWSNNQSNIQQRFCAALSNVFNFPEDALRIEHVRRVDQNSFNLHMLVRASHRQMLIRALTENDETSRANLEKIKDCCSGFNVSLYSVILGEFGLNIEERIMDPRWNRIYAFNAGEQNRTYWSIPIDQGGRLYFCPSGWTRYGIKVAENDTVFDAKWGSWCIAYHGTKSANATMILETGLRPSTAGCFIREGNDRVYLTPSIEYAAHPRYARPWIKDGKPKQWFQMVFQCRVNPKIVKMICPETLIRKQEHKGIAIDRNFSNEELEWVIPTENEDFIKENIICYGFMVRKLIDCDPKDLDASHWWKYTYADRIDYDAV